MRKIYLTIIIYVVLFSTSFGQVTYTWTGPASGDYQLSSNWSPLRISPAATDILAFNPTSPIIVSNVSNESIGAIQIASGTSSVSFATNSFTNVLKLTSSVPLIYNTSGSILSADYLTINLTNAAAFSLTTGTFGIAAGTGGKILINSAVTLNGGTLDFDEPGTGGTVITGSITYISGTFASANASAITWTGSSNYYHAVNGVGISAIPISTWQASSTCTITGMNAGATAPTGLNNNNFANFSWNCPLQSVDVELNWVTGNIGGTLSIQNSNNKYIHLSSTVGGVFTVGNYIQTGGNVMLQSSSGNTILSISGSFTQSAGILDGVGGTSAGIATLDLKGAVTKSANWQSSSSNTGAVMNIQFSGTGVQTVSIAGVWTAPVAGRSNITITNSNLITGVNLTANSVLKVFSNASAATLTMAGIITPADATAYVSYVGNGTLLYAASFSQTASAVEFPSANGPANLTINNSLGVKFPSSFNRSLPGTLSMVNGNLSLDDFATGNKLELTNSSLAIQLSYTSGFITTGKLGRYFPVSGLPTSLINAGRFPFGSGVNDRSLNVYFSYGTLSTGTAGMVYVSHTPVSGVTAISPTVADNGVSLDKRTNTYWTISTGSFSIGSGPETISLTATAANIGSVDNYATLRLTDGGASAYGIGLMPNPNTGTTSIPVTGKAGLTMSDLNKNLYIASDGTSLYNPLVNITFNWKGSVSSDWTNPNNWAGLYAVGYPSASTEIAIIDNSLSPTYWPTINTGTSVSIYQLTVNSGITLTLAPSSNLNVYDNVNFSGGAASLSPTSTFGYSGSGSAQNIESLTYGNLSISGTAAKTFPSTLTVTGDYSVSGSSPILGTNTFIYAGAGTQRIAAANYYNLTITGNRSGGTITLGNPPTVGTIDIANTFDVSGLSNYNNPVGFSPQSETVVNFSSTGSQNIPGFYYPKKITNSGNGNRVLDNLGSADPTHIIYTRAFTPGLGTYTSSGSKVNFYVTGLADAKYVFATNLRFNDLEFSGDMKNYNFDFFPGPVYVAGKFFVSLTNYIQPANNTTTIVYNGTGDQTIDAYKTNGNTPSFKYPNIVIQGAGRNVTLAGSNTDTIHISGTLQVPRATLYNADFGYFGLNLPTVPFSAGKGFIVNGSTVNFSYSSSLVPLLIPSASGTYNYNNLVITSGTHSLESDMTINGNLSVEGIDATSSILNIGDGNSNRILNILGNMSLNSTGNGLRQVDMNNGTNGSTKINLAGNLAISGNAQLMGTTSIGTNNGVVIFNGNTQQNYSNTSSTYKNGLVNFVVGNSTTPSSLTLGSSINLLASSTLANKSSLTVTNNSSLNCGGYNVISNGSGNANFNLNAGATFITANTGGIEGGANTPSNGSIINDASIEKNYDPLASYVFNASSNTNTNFPTAATPFPLANLTLGDDINAATFSLNKSIDASNTLTLKDNCTLAIGNAYLNLKSTSTATARVAPVPTNASVTYGTGRFVVERYYPQRRSWRLVTAPITADAGRSVFTSWQLGNAPFLTSGSGTFVTGKNASASNGLDISPLNNSSLKTYNGINFVDVTDSKNLLLSGTGGIAGTPDNIGFFLFVRGDRNPAANLFNIPNMNNTTLRDTGKIQIKDQVFNVGGAGGSFALIGNPYASPVDITDIIASSSNIDPNYFWAFDPRINTEQGAYVSMVLAGGAWIAVPSNPTVTQDKNIQSGQAIFVRKLNSSPGNLSFHESDKSSQNNLNMFRAASQSSLFTTNLYLQQPDTAILADGNLEIYDNNYSAAVDFNDAPKFGNIKETFGLMRDSKMLAVERRPEVLTNDTIFFRLTKTSQRNYSFEFIPQNFNPVLTAFLEDRYIGSKTPINLATTSNLKFSVNSDTGSAAPERFMIVFKNALAAGPLPVTFKSIKAYQQNNDITVEWAVENELNINKYELEKSADGVTFTKIYITASKSTNGSGTSYSFVDKNPFTGNNFYRVVSYNQTGGGSNYSKVVVVTIDRKVQGINIFPNPLTGNKFGLRLNGLPSGKYNLKLLNSLGQIMMFEQINYTGGNSVKSIILDNKLSAGIYQLEVTRPDESTTTIKVVAE